MFTKSNLDLVSCAVQTNLYGTHWLEKIGEILVHPLGSVVNSAIYIEISKS